MGAIISNFLTLYMAAKKKAVKPKAKPKAIKRPGKR
jgi:hypothetical protein